MASQTQPEEHKKSMSMAMAAVPQLLTPDQPLSHTFVVSGPEPRMPSPPASPEFNAEATFQHKDDVLYPDHTNADNNHSDEKPLFESSGSWASPEREQRSPTASTLSVSTPRSSISQQGEQLPPIQSQKSTSPVGPVQLFNTFGMEYHRFMVNQNQDLRRRKKEAQREEELEQARLEQANRHRKLPLAPRSRTPRLDDYTQGLVRSLGRTRIDKPGRAAVTKVRSPKAVPAKPTSRSQASVTTSKSDSPPKRSRRKTATPDPSLGAFSTAAQPKPRTRAAPSKKIDDKQNSQWQQLPDYCPPIKSLDTMSKKMSATWNNGNALNLDGDTDREQLHPQELVVASTLRLHCNSYLANKRRIFAARYQALLDGKDFNKTSAQVSAKIDVNKSSKLWEAFDSVGWFDKHWFEQYM